MKIAFEGAVGCRDEADGMLTFHGRTRGAADRALYDTDVLMRDARPPPLPGPLHDAQLIELGAPHAVPRRFELVSGSRRVSLQARSVQYHRAVGAAMFAAVPATHLPWSLRTGWLLLLSVLRVPGVGRLLLRRGGAS
jgi:hypothetical protein